MSKKLTAAEKTRLYSLLERAGPAASAKMMKQVHGDYVSPESEALVEEDKPKHRLKPGTKEFKGLARKYPAIANQSPEIGGSAYDGTIEQAGF